MYDIYIRNYCRHIYNKICSKFNIYIHSNKMVMKFKKTTNVHSQWNNKQATFYYFHSTKRNCMTINLKKQIGSAFIAQNSAVFYSMKITLRCKDWDEKTGSRYLFFINYKYLKWKQKKAMHQFTDGPQYILQLMVTNEAVQWLSWSECLLYDAERQVLSSFHIFIF